MQLNRAPEQPRRRRQSVVREGQRLLPRPREVRKAGSVKFDERNYQYCSLFGGHALQSGVAGGVGGVESERFLGVVFTGVCKGPILAVNGKV